MRRHDIRRELLIAPLITLMTLIKAIPPRFNLPNVDLTREQG